MLFPYDTLRDEQDKLLHAIENAIAKGGNLVAHAPTGLGKTAAALTPAIENAIEHNRVVIFCTSRLTQHALALKTVQDIREKHNVEIPVIDLIGKQHMCLQPNAGRQKGREFSEYCKNLREDGLCEPYERLKKGEELSPVTKSTLVQIGNRIVSPDDVKGLCGEAKICPYEVTILLARNARVIVTDYSYICNPRIREGFLSRIGRSLSECILVMDEGHNLPDRVKDLATSKITSITISRALKELEKHDDDSVGAVANIGKYLSGIAEQTKEERVLEKEEFLANVGSGLVNSLNRVAVVVREEQQTSSAGALADFIEAWRGPEEGYVRIFSRDSKRWELGYRCLDPSLVTAPVFSEAKSTIVMSGTLTPTHMFTELLGIEAEELTLPSPFPQERRLNLIVPRTTTKFTSRSPAMYMEIGKTCIGLVDTVPGNVAVFFPSYALMENVRDHLETKTVKTVFAEQPGLTREEREGMLLRFRSHKLQGAVLLGVMGGSFGEGIDLPGDELRGVIIVGLPLGKPDLETKALIDYYQEKFGKGWDYGYIYPAFTRTLQSAGRCIRSESDKGIVVFLDERYAWEQYRRCFPDELHIKITLKEIEMVRGFFDGT